MAPILFAFILHVANPTGMSTFVIDYDLELEDCLSLRAQWEETLDGKQWAFVTCLPTRTPK